ncbi:MAG TPA: LysM peptidoglycan-binding domain-containing protein [Candidatus Limnocylindria bacterium]|nr:LysM peptidoglycan-binding domain-containing protein [Candidatus Limnocylindria bacterium]
MSRPRLTIAGASIATTLLAAPILATVALGADEVIVRSGDTLTAIARRHDLTLERLVDLNDLADPNRIFVGQRLRLEPASDAPSDAGPAPSAAESARTHTVRGGEHLTGIARMYGTTIAAIARANNLADPSRIYAGQRLTIPGASGEAAAAAPAAAAPKPAIAAAPAAVPAARSHIVRAGEHLTGIARAYGTTIGALAKANGLADPSRIYAGQRLAIPGAAPATPAPSGARGASAMPASMASLVAERGAVRSVIVAEAERFGVPPAFALAVAWQESGWQQGVVSWAGAVGVMQLLPGTGEWVGEAMLGTPVDLTNTTQNVRAGVRLLAHYLDRYDGNRDLVLAAYYQGQTAADRHGVFAVSRPYIASIRALETLFGS